MRDNASVIADAEDAPQQPEESGGVPAASTRPTAADEQDRLGVRSDQKIGANYGLAVGVLSVNIRRRVASHRLLPEYINEECLSVFAEPTELGEALDILRNHRVVVLVGPRGVGRHTTAVRLLSSFGAHLREVQRDPGPISVEDLEHLHEDTRWLLDLRNDEDTAPLSFGRALADLTDRLERENSHLVVAIREDLWDRVGNGGRHLEIQLTPPPAVEVVKKRLAFGPSALSDPDIRRWTTADRIANGIRDLLPGAAIEWAKTIHEQHITALRQHATTATTISDLDPKQFDKLVDNVVKARADWRDHLVEWHDRKPEEVRRRYFLLAAALMENSPAGEIYQASEAIAEALGDKQGRAPGLQGPGILSLSRDVDAELVDGEYLRFIKPGYGDAVLEYFWADRLHQREPFIKWMTNFAVKRGDELADAVIDRIATYVLRWSVKRRNLSSLETLLRSWVGHQNLSGAAVNLVTAAALDPSLGKAMRDKMLTWARSDRPEDEALKPLVARASSGPLFEIYPTMMLYRLGCIANAPGMEGSAAVQEAISTMWRAEHLRPRLISEVSRWCQSESPPRRMVGRNAFIAIAGLLDSGSQIPVLLHPWLPNGSKIPATAHGVPGNRDRHEGPGWLMAGWRAVLDERDASDEVCALLATWMDAALESEAAYRLIAEILLGAVHGADGVEFSARRKTFLTDLLYHWCPVSKHSPEPRRALREQFLYQLTVIDPDHNIPGHRVSGAVGDSISALDAVRVNGTKGAGAGDGVDGDASSGDSETAMFDA